mgnify:CR=1 FL=1
MSKSRLELNREIQEGVNDYEYKKNLRKKKMMLQLKHKNLVNNLKSQV